MKKTPESQSRTSLNTLALTLVLGILNGCGPIAAPTAPRANLPAADVSSGAAASPAISAAPAAQNAQSLETAQMAESKRPPGDAVTIGMPTSSEAQAPAAPEKFVPAPEPAPLPVALADAPATAGMPAPNGGKVAPVEPPSVSPILPASNPPAETPAETQVQVTVAPNQADALSSGTASTTLIVPPTLAAPPTGLSSANVSASGFELRWNPVSDATGYRVYQNGTGVATVTGTGYGFAGLSAQTTYQLEVTSLNAAGESGRSASLNVTTALPPVQIPAAPSGLSSNVTSNGFFLSWASVPGATGYQIYRNGSLATTSTGTSASFSVSPGSTHSLQVRAVNSAGESAFSESLSVTTPYPLNPAVSVSPAAAAKGATYSQNGTGFTPNGQVNLFVRYPGDAGYTSIGSETADGSGSFYHSYNSITATRFGSYSFYAQDQASGRSSTPQSFTLNDVAPQYGYRLLNSSSTNGGGTWNSIMTLTAIQNGNSISFVVNKNTGAFTTASTGYLKVGTFESYGENHAVSSIPAGTASRGFSDDMSKYATGWPKSFYVRVENNDGFAWVGPIQVERYTY